MKPKIFTQEQFAANDSRMTESAFSIPLDGRHSVNYSVGRMRANEMIANSSKHPGFAAVAQQIADKEGIPLDHAKAIAAGAARHASASAKKKNPHLKRV